MSDNERLGANIRSLRKAYGETQEQLGEVIHVEKNTVSYYETGKREPSKETITAIAQHFMISVEELLHSDLSDIGTITVDKNAFWKNIGIIFPVISSEKAINNASFKRGIDAHRELNLRLLRMREDSFEHLDVCIDSYIEAAEDEEIEAEALANFLALWYLMHASMKLPSTVLKYQTAAFKQVVSRDEEARKSIEIISSSFESEAQAVVSEVYEDEETKEMIIEMLTTVKKSRFSDLADYYLALQYVLNLVDNDLDWGFNQRIGSEMMHSFASVKNYYADQFIEYNIESFYSMSSQSVDDN